MAAMLSLVNLGLIYYEMKMLDEAELYLKEAKMIFEDSLKNIRHPFYLNCLHDLANLYEEKHHSS